MRSIFTRSGLIAGVLFATAACATSEDWRMWHSHNTHFASGTHGVFSLRNNKDGSNPRVSRTDVDAARQESWWGKAITVSPEQIFQN